MDNLVPSNNSSSHQEESQTNLAFLDDNQSVSFRVKDLVFLLLRNLHWLIIFAVIGGLIANFHSRRQEKVYQSSAKVLIRNGNDVGVSDSDTRELSVRTALGLRSFYTTTINNEMMILTSKSALLKVVEELKLNVVYSTKTDILKREKSLYGVSPIEIEYAEDEFMEPDYLSIRVIDKDNVLIIRPGSHSLYVPMEKVVVTPMGKLIVHKTWAFDNDIIGNEIKVDFVNKEMMADYYRSKLHVERNDDRNTILNIYLRDSSPQRCADVINMVVRVYNEGAVNDKKRIINETYNFIN
jgi:hypothetical protein